MAKKKTKKTKQKSIIQKLMVKQDEHEEKHIEEINNKLQLSFIMDLQKPNVDKFERAEVIKHYMVRNIVSFKEMCSQLHIGKSTLSGWLKWGEMSKDEYINYKNEGVSETEITNMLKGTVSSTEGLFVSQLRTILKTVVKMKTRNLSITTWELIKKLRNDLNYMEFQGEKNGRI